MLRAVLLSSCVLAACSASGGVPSSDNAGGTGGGLSGSGGFPSGGSGGSTGGSGGQDSGTEASVGGTGSGGSGGSGACKSSCLGNECGSAMPDLCGGTVDCGLCGDNTDYCIVLTPVHQGAVKKAIEDTKLSNPELFDPSDTNGDGWKVVNLGGFTGNLVTLLIASGRVALVDPNDENEIRVRATSESTAENYHVHTSAGYSAYKYTSTCSPANF